MKLKNFSASLLMLLSVFALSFSACESDDDDDMIVANNDKTVLEFLQDDDQFSTLYNAIVRAGLSDALDGEDDDITLFAPTNAAFDAANIDLENVSDEDLKSLLLYHVIPDDDIEDTELTFQDRYFETAAVAPNGNNYSIYLEREDGDFYVNQYVATSDSENEFENGVIYELANVLSIPSVVDVVSFDKDLERLKDAVINTDLVDALTDANITVFAPKDDGFEDIEDETDDLTADQLKDVLTYHVVAGQFEVSDLEDDQLLTTLNGEQIEIDIDLGIIEIKDASGNETRMKIDDIQTTDGIIHIIDDVLMPSDL